MLPRPSIAIGIITHSRPEFLREALESVFSQAEVADEVIVVSDGESEATRSIIANFPGRIEFAQIPESGRSAARNKVVELLKSDYLLWLDDDDVLLPHAVSSQRKKAEADPEAEIIYSNLVVCNAQMQRVSEERRHPLVPRSLLFTFFRTVPIANGGTMIHRSCFQKVGPYDSYYERGQDYDFFARAASAGAKLLYNDDYFYLYRSHEGSTASRENLEKFYHFRVAVMRSILQRHRIDHVFSHLPWQANQAVALLQACQEASVHLVRYRGYDEAIGIYQQAAIHPFTELVGFLTELLQIFREGDLSKLDKYANNLLYFTEMSRQLIDAYLPNALSAEERDAWRSRYLGQRLTSMTIEQVYSQLDWQNQPERSFIQACLSAIGEFIECGDEKEALDLVSQMSGVVSDDVISFYQECIRDFSIRGLEGVRKHCGRPDYYDRFFQLLLTKIGNRALKLHERSVDKQLLETSHLSSEASDIEAVKVLPRSSEDTKSLDRIELILEEAAKLIAGEAQVRMGDLFQERKLSKIFQTPSADSVCNLSVIVPTVDRPKLLVEAVQSVALQAVSGVEVVVVIDGGPLLDNDTLAKLKSFPVPVSIYRHERNYGLAATRNSAISNSRGEWILPLDDDDILLSGAISSMLKAARAYDVEVIHGDHLRQYIREEYPYQENYNPGEPDVASSLQVENSHLVSGSYIIKKDTACVLGGYRQDLPVQEDYNFILRAISCAKFHYEPTATFVYRINEGISRMNSTRRLEWFGTSALNHSIYRRLKGDETFLHQRQRSNQYEHIGRALHEGFSEQAAIDAVSCWWRALLKYNLVQEVQLDKAILEQLIPELMRKLSNWTPSKSNLQSSN